MAPDQAAVPSMSALRPRPHLRPCKHAEQPSLPVSIRQGPHAASTTERCAAAKPSDLTMPWHGLQAVQRQAQMMLLRSRPGETGQSLGAVHAWLVRSWLLLSQVQTWVLLQQRPELDPIADTALMAHACLSSAGQSGCCKSA